MSMKNHESGHINTIVLLQKAELVKLPDLMHFIKHFTFCGIDCSKRGKRLEKHVKAVIAIELVTAGKTRRLVAGLFQVKQLQQEKPVDIPSVQE